MAACSSSPQSESSEEGTQVVPVEKREYNYITGESLNGETATDRPVAIMVDNSKYALPQYGISDAEIIYEMVTEGGITRLMAVYSDLDDVVLVGPVRSARDQLCSLYFH